MPQFKEGDKVRVSVGPLKGRTGVIVSFHLASAPREFALGGNDANRTILMYQITVDAQDASQATDGMVMEDWLWPVT